MTTSNVTLCEPSSPEETSHLTKKRIEHMSKIRIPRMPDASGGFIGVYSPRQINNVARMDNM